MIKAVLFLLPEVSDQLVLGIKWLVSATAVLKL